MIYIGADHRGLELKNKLAEFVISRGYEITDLGNTSLNLDDDYVDYAFLVAQSVARSSQDKGILICGSGVGVDIVANKYRGIRAGLVFDKQRAVQSRQHEDVNIICLAADVISGEQAIEIVQAFLETSFSHEERHIRRVNKIKQIEQSL